MTLIKNGHRNPKLNRVSRHDTGIVIIYYSFLSSCMFSNSFQQKILSLDTWTLERQSLQVSSSGGICTSWRWRRTPCSSTPRCAASHGSVAPSCGRGPGRLSRPQGARRLWMICRRKSKKMRVRLSDDSETCLGFERLWVPLIFFFGFKNLVFA